MPELPEVEVVRRGLSAHVVGQKLNDVRVRHPRAARHNEGGAVDVEKRLEGREVVSVERRGKYMWLLLDDDQVLLVHLGMSGQMLIKPGDAGEEDPSFKHARAAAELADGSQLWFVDQRTFGYWWMTELVDTPRGTVPAPVAHIARDLLDPELDLRELARTIKAKPTEIKRLLLNQEVVAGIGNIYADEMLWAAGIHGRQKANRLALVRIEKLLEAGQEVMSRALEQGGTSFDALYVNVNGESGYFDVSLNAYGQQGRPCQRCGTLIVREKFMNRGSHFCPKCQRLK